MHMSTKLELTPLFACADHLASYAGEREKSSKSSAPVGSDFLIATDISLVLIPHSGCNTASIPHHLHCSLTAQEVALGYFFSPDLFTFPTLNHDKAS